MSKISFDAKGLYFFDYEIEALKEVGFVFDKKLRKKRGQKGRVFKVVENPDPIENNPEREKFIKEMLPFMMGPFERRDERIFHEQNPNIRRSNPGSARPVYGA